MWKIGCWITTRIRAFDVHTALQLKVVAPHWMRNYFTVIGKRLILELNGISCLGLEEFSNLKKSIQVSRSFGKPITEFDNLRSTIATYETRHAQKLQTNCLKQRIFWRKSEPIFFDHIKLSAVKVATCTTIEDEMYHIKAATQILEQIYKEYFAYHKTGLLICCRETNSLSSIFSLLSQQIIQKI